MNKRKRKQLAVFFNEKLKKWEKEKQGEYWYLKIRLTNLMNEPVSFGSNDFWRRIVNYILAVAEKMNISPKQLIENLFDEEDSEAWILALRMLNE